MGFSKEDIAIVVKSTALWSSILSGLAGGMIMLKLGINRALWLFGLVQMVTIGGFIWLSAFGHFDVITSAELWKLGVVIAAEYIGVGLGTAAFVALWRVRVILFILQHSLHFYKPFSFAK